MKTTLSFVVSVFNGEDVLKECLESARFADEIIVVDNTSEDKTLEIAKMYTKNIFTRTNNPMLNINKNFGISKAKGDWILYLDADERITPELQREIKSEIRPFGSTQGENPKSEIAGFWIPRKNIIFGKWMEHTGWYPDHQLRLIRQGKGRFPEKHVHEMIKVDGKTSYLKNNLEHYNYKSVQQFLHKMSLYVQNEADQLLKNGYMFNWIDAIRFPIKEFLSRFFARKGYRDGLHGLVLSLLMAFYHLLVFATIWEKRGFEKIDNNNFFDQTEQELRRSYKDFSFWFNKEKINSTKSLFKKVLYKTIRKAYRE